MTNTIPTRHGTPDADSDLERTPVTVWALWDAPDLVSLHATEQGAREARDAHLHDLGAWSPQDQQLLEAATQIVAVVLQQP